MLGLLMKDHDQLFKILVLTLLEDFLQAFVPDLHQHLEIPSVRFLDREHNRVGRLRRMDVLAQVKLAGQSCYVLVLIEIQSQRDPNIGRRILCYLARMVEELDLPVFPIVLVTHPAPGLPAQANFELRAGPFTVATVRYRNVAVKSLDWRRFVRSTNPAEIALMSVMKIAAEDRVKVKTQIFRLLATLKLDPKKLDVIAGFVESFLEFGTQEQLEFERELDKVESGPEKETIMQLLTSWEKKGLEKGRQEGRQEGLAEGMLRARQLAILDALEARNLNVTAKTKAHVGKLTDETALKHALRKAITAASIKEFLMDV